MRLIAKLLVLVAVLLLPLGMQPVGAAPNHDMAVSTMPMGHCPEHAPSHDGKGGFVECTMACSAALPAAELAPERHLLIACAPSVPAAAQILRGLHPETATPPPKAS